MKNRNTFIAVAASIFIASCQNSSKINKTETEQNVVKDTMDTNVPQEIAFTLIRNYFVKNTVKVIEQAKIESAEKFNEIFGMATTMGKDGKPTEIDFTKQYVIAVIKPETDLETTLEPVSLSKDSKNKLSLNYKFVQGQKQSYTIRPFFAIIVDKALNGEIELNELR